MPDYPITERTKMKRGHKRATYDQDTVHSILDEAYLCHIGVEMDDKPMVQPTFTWRDGERIFIHGSSKNGLFQSLLKGKEACITVTILDGLVMARSSFHHSANYRCVMVFSKATLIEDDTEKNRIFDLMMMKMTPDRFDQVRAPNKQEMKATTLLSFDLKEVSAKIRTGPPVDDEEDYALPVWAGEIPIKSERQTPVSDPRWVKDFKEK